MFALAAFLQIGSFTSDMAMCTSVSKESMASGAAKMTTRDFAIGSFLMVNGGKNFKGEQVMLNIFY